MNPMHSMRVIVRHYRQRLHDWKARWCTRRLQRATRIPHKGPDYFAIGRKDRF